VNRESLEPFHEWVYDKAEYECIEIVNYQTACRLFARFCGGE
jgi:hypothetical protein